MYGILQYISVVYGYNLTLFLFLFYILHIKTFFYMKYMENSA